MSLLYLYYIIRESIKDVSFEIAITRFPIVWDLDARPSAALSVVLGINAKNDYHLFKNRMLLHWKQLSNDEKAEYEEIGTKLIVKIPEIADTHHCMEMFKRLANYNVSANHRQGFRTMTSQLMNTTGVLFSYVFNFKSSFNLKINRFSTRIEIICSMV